MTDDLIFGEDGDFYAAKGWCSAKELLKRILGFGDFPSTLREVYDDWATPMVELRRAWTAGTTRGWMRPGDPTTATNEWDEEDPDWFFICAKDHPKAEKWTYWQA